VSLASFTAISSGVPTATRCHRRRLLGAEVSDAGGLDGVDVVSTTITELPFPACEEYAEMN